MTARMFDVAIVGGGLSGLYAAWQLARMGVDAVVVIEARAVPGGRIASFYAGTGRFDLGPTWFWPALQPQLDRVVRELGLTAFAQHEAGDMMVEPQASAPPVRVRGYANVPASMRLAGGMEALVDALRRRLHAARIVTGQAVRRLRRLQRTVELETGDGTVWRARHVLLAVPPRVVMDGIEFEPALPAPLADAWRAVPTWMAPHAKYVAVYDTPFWRDAGLSGEGRSVRGPLGEIHDASVPGGGAALFGFFGVAAHVRAGIPDDALRARCRAQLARLFGPQGAAPLADAIKDWASDPFTATAADLQSAGQHAAPAPCAPAGPWHGCLTGIASEWSPRFPGYVAGAIDAADRGVRRLIDQLENP